MMGDQEFTLLICGILGILVVASLIGWLLAWRKGNTPVIINLNERIKAWWMMCAVVIVAIWSGAVGAIILFALISFLALRECVTLTPTRRGDHEAMFWCFFILMPLQYLFVGMQWYGLFAIFIPVYVFLFIPTRIALQGDTRHFLERTAKIQWSMMIAVYCVSHVPALLMLEIPGFTHNSHLILFLMIVVQISDVLQYVFGKLFGKRPIVPKLSPNKTIAGFVGGTLSASLVGMGLWWLTPFAFWQAFLISIVLTILGFAGGLCMSAIKRDSGVKDFGAFIEGHGGMMDRMDSLCFAAPVFFHLVRYFFT